MSALSKLLPIPSDRMGSIWNLLALKDSCLLEYGPAGTTHFGLGPLGNLGLEPAGRYFVTHMDESDVVMGDTSRLEQAAVEIDTDYAPEHLFIIGSSISSIIGTDLAGVVFYLQDQVGAKLHILDSGGFAGNYLKGTQEVYKLLGNIVRELAAENNRHFPKSKHSSAKSGLSFNILGASPDHFRVRSDIREIARLMSEALNMHLLSVYVTDGYIARLPESLTAACNLVLRPEALPLAQAMQETADIPYYEVCPYGYQGSLDMLETVARDFELSLDPLFVREVSRKQNELAMLPFYVRNLRQPLFIHSIGPDFLNKGLRRAAEEAGLNMGRQLLTQTPEEERIAFLHGLKGALLFADSQSIRLLPQGNEGHTCAFPWLRHSIIAEHLPLMGIRGMDFIAEKLSDYISLRSSL